MANTLSRLEVRRLARIGAESRLEVLRGEITSILRAFPELGRGGSASTRGGSATERTRGRGGRKRNWNMSDAQKRAVSERMKKYWAARRKEKSGSAKSAAKSAARKAG